MDSSKRPRPKELKGRDLEKRLKEDNDEPSPETLLEMFSVLRKHRRTISTDLATELHRAGLCQHIDIPACYYHFITCSLCKKRKKRTGYQPQKYIERVCKECLLDVASYVQTRPINQIKKFVCAKNKPAGKWFFPYNSDGELVQAYTVYERGQMKQKIADSLPTGEGTTGEFYMCEMGVELAPEQNS